jgi:hypothetical protein
MIVLEYHQPCITCMPVLAPSYVAKLACLVTLLLALFSRYQVIDSVSLPSRPN